MRKRIVLMLPVILTLGLLWHAACAEDTIKQIRINPYGTGESDMESISWFAREGKHFMFLPAGTDLSKARVYITADGTVTMEGSAIETGGSAALFTEGDHILECDGESHELTVCISENLPAVFITTQTGSLETIHQSKENKEPGFVRVYDGPEVTLSTEFKHIKGRGNSTWMHPKKAYNIKFDKKTALLGMPKAKKWTLLTNYFDYTLLHNAAAFFFAEGFGLPYTSEYRYVDLYINGDYMGNYCICESVEIGENRIEIDDLEKATEQANPGVDFKSLPIMGTGTDGAVQDGSVKGSRKWASVPNDPGSITGGYLLEYDYIGRYNAEPCGFVTGNGQPVVIKSPEYASEAQVNYIADLYEAAICALYSETGYNDEGRHYSDYFDMDSLVNMYILQEFSMNYDAATSSYFAFKPGDSDKIVFGPVWDMDNAFGSRNKKYGIKLTNALVWWANMIGNYDNPTMLTAAYMHDDFREAVAERWAQLRKSDLFDRAQEFFAGLRGTLAKSVVMNALRWEQLWTTSAPQALDNWLIAADKAIAFVTNRTAALDKGFGENNAYLYYDKGGISSDNWGFAPPIAEIGDTIILKDVAECTTTGWDKSLTFVGWNTERDGSGTMYMPGDSFTLTHEYEVLYAQWSAAEPESAQ